MMSKLVKPSVKGKRADFSESPTQKRGLSAADTYVLDGLALSNAAVFSTSKNELLQVDSATLQTLWATSLPDTQCSALASGDGGTTFWSADTVGVRHHDTRQAATTGVLVGARSSHNPQSRDIGCVGPSSKPYTALATASTPYELAAGTAYISSEALVELWDTRSPAAPVRAYSESHSDDITSLVFNPDTSSANLLLSASIDGLFSIYDTRQADEDDCVLGVGQTNASLKLAGWTPNGVWALSDMMTLQLWSVDAEGPELQTDFGDVREIELPTTWATDYVIQCDGPTSASASLTLWLGSSSGGVASVSVPVSQPDKWNLRHVWRGGHSEIVRCVVSLSQHNVCISGGEDASICAWSTHAKDQQPATSTAKQKSGRFKPY